MKYMNKTYNIVKKNGDAIRMKINEDKCDIMNNTKEDYTLLLKNIPIVDETNQQKYLGIELEQKVSVEKYCKRVINEVQHIIYNICNEELSFTNMIRKINTNVISKLRYSFSIVHQKLTELDMLDMKIRKCLYECGLYSKLLPKSRLYISISLF